MTFAKMIDQVVSSANSKNNILTDGQLTCYYRNIPDFFKSIDKYFADNEIRVENNLAIECVNSVSSALTLLYLLKKGYSFFLSPLLRNGRKECSVKPLMPKFCQYKITIEKKLNNETTEPDKYPENLLRVERCEQRCFESKMESNGGGKLNLRTSGSTAASKIVVHSHVKLLGNATNCVKRYQFESEDRIAIPVPISHLYGFGAAFLPGIIAGASIDFQENSNILRYMGRERKFEPNIAFLTPALCEMLLKGHKASRTYKLVVTSGERIKKDIFFEFESRFGRLVNQYGSTEMGAIAASYPDDPIEVRATTIGKPMPGVHMRLTKKSSESDEEVAGIGELCCKHEYGFEGYIDEYGNRISQGVPTPSDWFETGDLAKIQQNGSIEVIDRCDHSVVRRGFLVLFADIERAMERIEATERVVVVAKGESKQGKRIVAFCVLRHRNSLSSEQIRAACFDLLPRYAIPDDVFLIDSMPTLPNGKVDRQALLKIAPSS